MLTGSTGRACSRLLPGSQVFTRGTPPRMEGCRPASRGLALALMTWAQSRNRTVAVDSIVTNMVFRPLSRPNNGGAGRHKY
ncbi:hypothetical protein NicSoilC5_41450 [Arthrobacter sp. NicSoilC5]|nr:hypothetical protein NicSoilC5_41450 [Arthrobacter sp. NicSoilC5]